MRDGGDDCGPLRWFPLSDRPAAEDAEMPKQSSNLYDDELAAFRAHCHKRRGSYCTWGNRQRTNAVDPCELAAWTMAAMSLLNLDEVVTQH